MTEAAAYVELVVKVVTLEQRLEELEAEVLTLVILCKGQTDILRRILAIVEQHTAAISAK
jgi:hypothetical protein